ncbi:MAG TPA: Rrf2 family transcriptional regulator [Usitatibacter sp.]|nr:Rrf2 family transcriptional regulator [Usitatibacter sp.]
MRLTYFTDYSLRVLIYMATAPERRVTIAEIAKSFDISENHLTKVVHFLGKEGLLLNVRGRGGGLQLAVPPAQINVGSVVHKTEHGDVPAECFKQDENKCSLKGRCRLEGVLAEAIDSFYEVLGRYTLADLVKNRAVIAKILFHEHDRVERPARKRAA